MNEMGQLSILARDVYLSEADPCLFVQTADWMFTPTLLMHQVLNVQGLCVSDSPVPINFNFVWQMTSTWAMFI